MLMKMLCTYHEKEHDDYEWRSNTYGTYCREALAAFEDSADDEPFHIGIQRTDARIDHWGKIKSRVTTHEGEIIDGKKGRDYQIKYSKKYLGRDMAAPPDFRGKDYQKQLSKTK